VRHDWRVLDLDREVKEALEAEGYEVESVRPHVGDDGVLRRSADPHNVPPDVLWLAIYLVSKVGDELSSEAIAGVIAKAKEIILRKRREGDRQAQATKTVGVWVRDPSSGGMEYLADSEGVDE
jgi:hypothetical protein